MECRKYQGNLLRTATWRRPHARRRWFRQRVLRGERGTNAKGTMGESSAGWPRPPSDYLSRPPPPPSTPWPAPVPLLGQDLRPHPQCTLHAPHLNSRLRASQPPARASARAHPPSSSPRGGKRGRVRTHLSGRSGGRGRPGFGGRGRALVRALHLPLPAARAEGARQGPDRRGRSGIGRPRWRPLATRDGTVGGKRT